MLAFLSYLLLAIGGVLALVLRRNDPFVAYHARQSLMLTLVALVTPVAWMVTGWVMTWVPLVGSVVSAALFSIVILVYFLLVIAWLAGMNNALRARLKPVPFFGGWVKWFSRR